MIDFENRRAIVVDGHDTIMTFTSIQDLAAVVVRAVDVEAEWPVIGGISGNRMSVAEIIKIGEKIRGLSCLHDSRISYLQDTQVNLSRLTKSNSRILRKEF